MNATPPITDDQIADWRRDGVVPLYNVFSRDWLALLEERV